jgi:hypothetical protein
MSENNNNLAPSKLAIVLDNVVAEVLHTDERLAAIFLSQPLVLEITENFESFEAMAGNIYDETTGKYMPPSPSPSHVWNQETKSWNLQDSPTLT